jgi:tetratricopeptide (TPR) repeat protein
MRQPDIKNASGVQMRRPTTQPRSELAILLLLLSLLSFNWSMMLLRREESKQAGAGDGLAAKEGRATRTDRPRVSADGAEAGAQASRERGLIDSRSGASSGKQDRSMATYYFKSGVRKFYSGDKAGAIRDYSDAIAADPGFAMAYYNRGDAKRHQGDYAGAVRDFSLSLRLKPRYAEAWGNRGLAKTKLGNNQEGCQDLRRGAELGSKISESLYRQICSQ